MLEIEISSGNVRVSLVSHEKTWLWHYTTAINAGKDGEEKERKQAGEKLGANMAETEQRITYMKRHRNEFIKHDIIY